MNCTKSVPEFLTARKRANNKGNINNTNLYETRRTRQKQSSVIEME